MTDDLAPRHAALQQTPGPRPLPLFLNLVQHVSEHDPELARSALEGLHFYQTAPRYAAQQDRKVVASIGGSTLLDCGGSGRPILLVPSLINPPRILDLDPTVSLAEALTGSGHVLLLDWGSSSKRLDLDISAHVTELLLPLLRELGEPTTLIGYCLGGTMAVAAAALDPNAAAVATLAAPWHFSAYPAEARAALQRLWEDARPSATQLGVLPIEVLQAAFWSLDPHRVVAKFAGLAALDPASPEAQRFIALEDWANSGEPLPLPAARELLVQLFGRDLPGNGQWLGAGLPKCPMLHLTASGDRIVPAETAVSEGQRLSCGSGHVGMIVGRSAPQALHAPLRQWLEALPTRG
ncbi:MAG TPA: alpha/beta hydrolase [Sphingomicrobium sp.]|nr:alpha/beta hydrolase [Sphingomicrobium sp.]